MFVCIQDHPYIKVEPTLNQLRHDFVDEDSDSDGEPIQFGLARNTVYSDGYLRPMTQMPASVHSEGPFIDIPQVSHDLTSDSSEPALEPASEHRRQPASRPLSARLSWLSPRSSRQTSFNNGQLSRQSSMSTDSRKLKKLSSLSSLFSAASRSLQATWNGSAESLNHGPRSKGLQPVKERRRLSSESAESSASSAMFSVDGRHLPDVKPQPTHLALAKTTSESIVLTKKDIFRFPVAASVPVTTSHLESPPEETAAQFLETASPPVLECLESTCV